MNLGEHANTLFELKKQKTELNKSLEELNKLIREEETVLKRGLEDHGLSKITDVHGTVYLSRQVVPTVVNWDELYEYIRTTNSFHMLERRPSRTAFREAYELGHHVPGLEATLFDEVRTRKD